MNFPHRNEIIIALIGLIGVIFTAVVSNYEKIFDEKSENESSFPYEKIDDLDMQLRYFIEVSGFRNSMEEMRKVSAEKYRMKHGASDTVVNCVLDNQIQTEQLIELFISVHKNHITLQQVKDLNRLYSSESMKSYSKSSPLIVRELISGIDAIYERMHIRNMAISGANKKQSDESCPAG